MEEFRSGFSMLTSENREFLIRFCNAVNSRRLFEIARIYDSEWRSHTQKFFKDEPWPTPAEISDITDGEPAFTVLYELLRVRHLLITLDRKSVDVYAESWTAYSNFFDLLLSKSNFLEMPAQWLYDTLNEFLYHYEKFHILRCNIHAQKMGDEEEEADIQASDAELAGIWNVRQVMSFLYRVVHASNIVEKFEKAEGAFNPQATMDVAGYMALTGLVRLHAKLGDFATALDTAAPINLASDAMFSRVPTCHVVHFYYVGFIFMMARRYHDATTTFARLLAFFHRTKHLVGDVSSRVLKRKADQILALLAICSVVTPSVHIDDNVKKLMLDSHGAEIQRLSTTEDTSDAEALFRRAAPSFIDPAFPPVSADTEAPLRQQLRLFVTEISQRIKCLRLRSLLRLYTSIDIPKVAKLTETRAENVSATLASLKLKNWQPHSQNSSVKDAEWRSADSLHFYASAVKAEEADSEEAKREGKTTAMVTVEENVVERSSHEFFVKSIYGFSKTMTDLAKGKMKNVRHSHIGGGGGK